MKNAEEIIKEVEALVKANPNDQELGKKIRILISESHGSN